MRKHVVVDTDVLIDYLRGVEESAELIRQNSERILLPALVVAELYAGARGVGELGILERFISLFRTVEVTESIARAGGLYRKKFGKSHGTGLADALIAATVDEEEAEFLTLNVKHYPMFPNLEPAYRKR